MTIYVLPTAPPGVCYI